MGKELIINLKSNTDKTKQKRQKEFTTIPTRSLFKVISNASEIFCLTKKMQSLLAMPPQPPNKTLIEPRHSRYNQLSHPTKPFTYPSILIKILIGIGQESNVLPKSSRLILTLPRKSSLPRVIENSPMGIVDSQERKFTKGGQHV